MFRILDVLFNINFIVAERGQRFTAGSFETFTGFLFVEGHTHTASAAA